jgi:hypothetical protein
MDEFRSSESALARFLDDLDDCLVESSSFPSDKGRFFDFDAIAVVGTYRLWGGLFFLDDEVDDSNTYVLVAIEIAIAVFVIAESHFAQQPLSLCMITSI